MSNISKDVCLYNYQTIWAITDQNISADFVKVIAQKVVFFYMLQKWKRAVFNEKRFGLLFTDLSKASDCFSHELFITKLQACSFSFAALKLI